MSARHPQLDLSDASLQLPDASPDFECRSHSVRCDVRRVDRAGSMCGHPVKDRIRPDFGLRKQSKTAGILAAKDHRRAGFRPAHKPCETIEYALFRTVIIQMVGFDVG